MRAIAGQNTLFTRTIHDMAYDSVRDEIVVPQFYAFAILTYKGDATGDAAPIRILEGPNTGFATRQNDTQRVTVDPVHNVLIASGFGGIRIFDRMAAGNTKSANSVVGVG